MHRNILSVEFAGQMTPNYDTFTRGHVTKYVRREYTLSVMNQSRTYNMEFYYVRKYTESESISDVV